METISPREAPTGGSARPSRSRKRQPIAASMPMPASFVALPPRPMMHERQPRRSASAISSPVPKELVLSGLRNSVGTSVSPLARAISMTAVPFSVMTYSATTGSPSGPCTVKGMRTAPPDVAGDVPPDSRPPAPRSASSVPSPPSATSRQTVSHEGNTSRTAAAAASATCREDKDPLKESTAMTIFRMIPGSGGKRPPQLTRSTFSYL